MKIGHVITEHEDGGATYELVFDTLEEEKLITDVAEKEGLTINEFIVNALKEFIKSHEKDQIQ